jgi:ABC-2 type transport system ATP-binding protein
VRLAIGLVQVLFMVAGPLALAAYLRSRWRLPWALWAVGAVGFIGSQVVHLPLVILGGPHAPRSLALQCAILGLLAGLCEEPARYLVYRFWLRKSERFEEAVLVGVGHGGIESIIFGVLVGAGLLGSLAVSASEPAGVRAAAVAILNAPPLERLLGSVERVFAITFHVAMSIVVLAAVRRRAPALLAVAIGLHAFLDAVVVWVHKRHSLLAAEGLGLVAALLGLTIILHARATARRQREAARGVVDHDQEPRKIEAISTRQLTKEFAGRTAVDGLTVDVPHGRVFALLGPNGAGKTTTVRLLCALIPPTRGTASVAGHRLVSDEDALRSRVGILTETPGLHERLTAHENLELFGRLYGLSQEVRAERIERHLQAFDLWERRDERVSGFSKGMKQKIAIVRALIHEPEVLFLDEPTSGLDPVASREVHDMILALKARGRTILLTTHRLTEAEELADLVGIFRTQLLALDTVANLKTRLFGRTLEVRVQNPSAALAEAVAALPDCGGASWQEGVLTVPCADPGLLAPRVVRALVQAGGEVVQVGEVKHSLEEVYLDLVKENA